MDKPKHFIPPPIQTTPLAKVQPFLWPKQSAIPCSEPSPIQPPKKKHNLVVWENPFS